MNLQYVVPDANIRLLITNPFIAASRMFLLKVLTGVVFGPSQNLDLILLVYEDEEEATELLKLELDFCAFDVVNSITVMANVPKISDADVFCFMTKFQNPNKIDFSRELTDDEFDSLYLLIKIAENFSRYPPLPMEDPTLVKRKPLFMGDGLVTLDILMSISNCIEYDSLYCISCLADVSKNILGDHLMVQCDDINRVCGWAANDEVLHVEICKPIIVGDIVASGPGNRLRLMSNEYFEQLKLERSYFNATWLKREFIAKVKSSMGINPYGPIFKATLMARTLRELWTARSADNHETEINYLSVGVISDGAIGTMRGLPYVLPVIFHGDSWTVDELYTPKLDGMNSEFETSITLQHCIRRINAAALEHHKKLIPYCKKFLCNNIINQDFIPSSESSFTQMSVQDNIHDRVMSQSNMDIGSRSRSGIILVRSESSCSTITKFASVTFSLSNLSKINERK